jgi:two-component system phosphate regulon response regulator PhoB
MLRKPVLLLQEPDVTRRRMMKFNLELEGFQVVAPDSLRDLREDGNPIDLAILYWDGAGRAPLAEWSSLRVRHGNRYMPILVIAEADREEDRVAAYDAGADDILVKPFSVPEFLARIRAILRRTSPELGGRVIRVGGLSMDVGSGKVTRDGVEVRLSQTEFRILQYLMEHAGKVRSREQIRHAVWESADKVEIRAIDVRITRLRRQLRLAGGGEMIRTVRTAGYVLSDEQPRVRSEKTPIAEELLGRV